MFRDPLRRNTYLRVNDNYDQQDVVVENVLSQKRQFQDMDKSTQLTQNTWNLSPYTRSDVYRDLVIGKPRVVGRMERYKTIVRPDKYHTRMRV